MILKNSKMLENRKKVTKIEKWRKILGNIVYVEKLEKFWKNSEKKKKKVKKSANVEKCWRIRKTVKKIMKNSINFEECEECSGIQKISKNQKNIEKVV